MSLRLSLLLLAVLAVSYGPASYLPHVATATTFRLHSNIYIGSDAGFTPANGVVGGLGTVSQPYVIEGWEIAYGFVDGISISGTTAYFIIRNVFVHDQGGTGITLQARNGQVVNSTVKSNASDGIRVFTSTNVVVNRNNVSSNGGGILVGGSDLVAISANNVANNGPYPVSGIIINHSTGVTVRGNHLTSNDIVPTGSPFQLSSLTITPDNTVDGKPVNYYYSCSGTTVSVGPPQDLIFAACNNIRVTQMNLSGTGYGYGIQLLSVNGAVLSGDTFSNFIEGVRVYNSTAITINNSNLSASSKVIDVRLSSSVTIQGDNFTSGDTGIFVGDSSKVIVSNNRLVGGVNGGIEILSSNTTTITNNSIIMVSHTAIWAEADGLSTNITDNSAMSNGIGIYFCACSIRFTVNGTISRNVVQNNGDGIDILGSCYCGSRPQDFNVTANNVSDNNVGVKLDTPFASFYHNNFISNAVQVSGIGYQTVPWDNGYPSGGNYWSDFVSMDNCSGPRQDICPSPDGIADTPYRIAGTATLDNYPLMKPFGPADTIQPSWPASSRFSGSNITQTSVTLTWTGATDDTGILSYRIYNGNNLIAAVSGSVHSFQVSGLLPGTEYTFTVEAVDAWGNTNNSDLSTMLRTSSTNQPAVISLLQQYWPLITVASVAGVGLLGLTVLWRRRKQRGQASTTRGASRPEL